MIPKRIILLRHGESEANIDNSVYSKIPDWQIALTDNGIKQALESGRKIGSLIAQESFGVFVSPYKRTLQTKDSMLERIGRCPVFDYQDPELREQEYGNMTSVEDNETNYALRKSFGVFFYRFPEGESCADVYDRMTLFMVSLFRRFERPSCPDNIVIVSHGTAIKCFLTRWYHWSVDRFESIGQLPNCHIAVMENNDICGSKRSTNYILSEPFSDKPILS